MVKPQFFHHSHKVFPFAPQKRERAREREEKEKEKEKKKKTLLMSSFTTILHFPLHFIYH